MKGWPPPSPQFAKFLSRQLDPVELEGIGRPPVLAGFQCRRRWSGGTWLTLVSLVAVACGVPRGVTYRDSALFLAVAAVLRAP